MLIMIQSQFQDRLREFLHREPFEPFLIELSDGQRLLIDGEGLAFAGSWATFLSSSYDLHTFTCEQVREIRLPSHETAP